MPKRITELPGKAIDPEHLLCVRMASRAAGKKSLLVESDFHLITRVALHPDALLENVLPAEDGSVPPRKPEEIKADLARAMSWILHQDAAGAARAILAAQKEMDRIRKTDLYLVRRTVRWMAIRGVLLGVINRQLRKPKSAKEAGSINRILAAVLEGQSNPKLRPFDMQGIKEEVYARHRINATDKTIHKALRLERAAQCERIP